MGYFNYHGKIKKLIAEGHLTGYEIVEQYKKIGKCLMLFFDCCRPMPVREYRFNEYRELLKGVNV